MKTTAAFFAALACASMAVAAPLPKRSTTVRFDDQNSQIAYPPTDSGNFVHDTNQDQSIFYDGTYSYSNDANAGYDFYLDDNAQSFSIWGGKKQDRGRFLVYTLEHDGATTLIGSGDQYQAGQGGLGTPSQQLFWYQLPAGSLKSFRVVNVPNDSRIPGVPYLGVDFVEQTSA